MSIAALDEEVLDTREGEDVTLKCRFNEQHSPAEFKFLWTRMTTGPSFLNVAIDTTELNINYK